MKLSFLKWSQACQIEGFGYLIMYKSAIDSYFWKGDKSACMMIVPQITNVGAMEKMPFYQPHSCCKHWKKEGDNTLYKMLKSDWWRNI
jgi:hypothetical protein